MDSIKSKLLVAACMLIGAAAGEARAAEWYLIYGKGKKPDRHVYFAQEAWSPAPANLVIAAIQRQAAGEKGAVKRVEKDHKGIRLVVVMESKERPDRVLHAIDFKCSEKMTHIKSTYTAWRDGRVENDEEEQWASIGDEWLARAHRFACMDAQSRDQSKGIAMVGDYVLPVDLADVAWKNFWGDSIRPPYTTTRSREEIDADLDSTIAKLGAMQNRVQSIQSTARKDFDENNQRGAEFQKKIMADTKRRQNTVNPRLETWIDATEQQLVQSWGNPPAFNIEGNSRFLSYSVGHINELRAGGGAGPVVNTESYLCSIRFEVRNGTVYTYQTSGYAQQCMIASFPLGPNPQNGIESRN